MSARTRLYTAAALLLLMAVTRVGHFGSDVSLPDASLAVFLLGGLWLGTWVWFAAGIALAVVIDVSLAKTAAEAAWCLTPAYWGLLPTYATLWLAGRWLARQPARPLTHAAAILGVVALTAVSLAFLISNLTFWAFSGMFGDMTATAYLASVARYYPSYLAGAGLYLALIGLVRAALTHRRSAATV